MVLPAPEGPTRKWKRAGVERQADVAQDGVSAVAEAHLLEFDHPVLSVACRASYTDAAGGATVRTAPRLGMAGCRRLEREAPNSAAPGRPPTEVAMRLTCPNCGAEYDVSDGMIPAAGRHVQCTACHTRWFVRGAAADRPDRGPDPAPPGNLVSLFGANPRRLFRGLILGSARTLHQ